MRDHICKDIHHCPVETKSVGEELEISQAHGLGESWRYVLSIALVGNPIRVLMP